MLGKILTNLGLGQNDLVEVTKGNLERISRTRNVTSHAEREAMSFALLSMVDELRDRDVATPETATKMRDLINEWYQG